MEDWVSEYQWTPGSPTYDIRILKSLIASQRSWITRTFHCLFSIQEKHEINHLYLAVDDLMLSSERHLRLSLQIALQSLFRVSRSMGVKLVERSYREKFPLKFTYDESIIYVADGLIQGYLPFGYYELDESRLLASHMLASLAKVFDMADTPVKFSVYIKHLEEFEFAYLKFETNLISCLSNLELRNSRFENDQLFCFVLSDTIKKGIGKRWSVEQLECLDPQFVFDVMPACVRSSPWMFDSNLAESIDKMNLKDLLLLDKRFEDNIKTENDAVNQMFIRIHQVSSEFQKIHPTLFSDSFSMAMNLLKE